MENTTHYALQVKKNQELAEHLLLVKKKLKHKEQLLQKEVNLRKKAQEKLQKARTKLKTQNQEKHLLLDSENRLRFLLQSTTTITYTCEAEAPFGATFISGNVHTLTGYTPQDYIQDPSFWANNIHPDDKERVFNGLNLLFEKGTHKHNYRWKYKNGDYRWMSDELKLIYDGQGNPIEMVGNWIDISNLKEAEENLIEANRNLLLAARAGGVGIWHYNIGKKEIKWDDQMYNIYGLTKQAFSSIYKSWQQKLHPDDKERFNNEVNKALLSKKEVNSEFRIIWPDMSIRYIQGFALIERDEAGNPLMMIGTNWDITESKQKERDLQLSLKEVSDYKHALDESSIVAITDQKGIIKSVNDNFCKISKYSREELIGQDHKIINSGFHTKEFIRDLWATIAKGNVWKGELRNKAKDGTIYWVNTTIVPFLNEQRKPYQYLVIREDITEKKLLEEGSKQKERSLQLSLKEVSDYKHALDESAIVAITDQKGIINSVNNNFCKISKYSREELIGQDHRVINSGFHTKEFIRDLWATIAKGKVWKGEIKNKAKDGTFYWVNTTIIPFLNEQGKPYQYIVIREDITENKLLGEEIKQFNIELEQKIKTRTQELTLSENRFRNLFENAPESILVLDLITLKFEKANKNGVKLFKFSVEQFIKMGPQDISPKFQPDGSLSEDKVKMYIEKAIQGEKVSFEWMHCDANNKNIPCEVQLALLPEAKKPRIYASIVDITIRIETREKLKQQNQKLAFQNDEIEKRANELTITNRELKKTNNELDRFVYSASHDLRAPLKSLLGLSDIIREDTDEDNVIQLEQMDMMKKSIIKLDDFIEDILQYSRNSRTEVVQEEMNFEETLQGLIKEYKHMEETKKIKLKVDIQQDLKFVSDKRRINIVLNNLISNAFKYQDLSKENQVVSIAIKCRNGMANIRIKDNGIGIDTKDQKKIFEMFYRATKASEGSGLGLYIVKETLDKLNGTITVKSELGKGTTFLVSLPNQLTVFN
ncbi:PAS domain-containing protein [Gelidibacter salicanalis]|uniref:histidine kinase n=1 Tax=Gelidibacter salicanalis TaxID=291193 RepID=A0A934KTA9_9FLAO|nr:PAS domain-containing protein [Gelidibacter salicanalis]MBJ7879773.1 PAS domain-containing protein [Gelidibacter salicanalis]